MADAGCADSAQKLPRKQINLRSRFMSYSVHEIRIFIDTRTVFVPYGVQALYREVAPFRPMAKLKNFSSMV
jgi:hypothetical protein